MCVFLWVYATWVQKSALGPLELELQAVLTRLMWVLGIKLDSLEDQGMLLNSEPSL